ncbi:MAG TPA: sigma factor [Pirellulales bacterium]|nr:sigma factor [Pirellulales bacterium]
MQGSATQRRKRRVARGGKRADCSLCKVKQELAAILPRYHELENKLTLTAYQVALNYLPRFLKERHAGPGIDEENLIQASVFKVLLAAHRFDCQRGQAFSWLTEVIKNEWKQVLRKDNNRQATWRKYADTLTPDRHRGITPMV